jgi:hypothetical protein
MPARFEHTTPVFEEQRFISRGDSFLLVSEVNCINNLA